MGVAVLGAPLSSTVRRPLGMFLLHALLAGRLSATVRVSGETELEEGLEEESQELRCGKYQVCKCESTGREKETKCMTNTCQYTKNKPFYCRGPETWNCTSPRDRRFRRLRWRDCEWTNFLAAREAEEKGEDYQESQYPGQGYWTDIPLMHSLTPPGDKGVQVLTDIDDTIVCGTSSGKCNKGEVFVGAKEFLLALSQGINESETPPKVLPITSRPRIFGKVPTTVVEAFDEVLANGHRWGIQTRPGLYGGVLDMIPFNTDRQDKTRFDGLGYRKYRRWVKARKKFGRQSIFVGDNARGDLVAAQMMLKAGGKVKEEDGTMRVAFIRDTKDWCRWTDCRTRWARHGMFFFHDYPDAAGIARSYGLITRESCDKVCIAARQLTCRCWD